MPKKRVKSVTSATMIPQLVFSESSNSNKTSESGLNWDTFLGAVDTAKECGAQKQVLVCNQAGTVKYVAFGAAGMSAPTGLSDGIMLAPNACRVFASGDNTHVRGSDNNVGAYVAAEDISTAPDQSAV